MLFLDQQKANRMHRKSGIPVILRERSQEQAIYSHYTRKPRGTLSPVLREPHPFDAFPQQGYNHPAEILTGAT